MRSLVVLMMEEEHPEGLSARKLVVETAKHNVLTAYSANDGIDLLGRFPNVNVVLVHARVLDQRPTMLAEIKALAPKAPIILASPGGEQFRPEATYLVDSHQPHQLITLLADGLQVDVSN
jgi:hypothetical protein